MRTATTTFIKGMAHMGASQLVPSSQLDVQLGLNIGTVEKKSGVAQRFVIGEGQTQESMAAEVAAAALKDAGLTGADIDLLLFASAVGRQPIPATAPLVKAKMGLSAFDFPAFDVNATCLSALVGLDVAQLYILSGRAKNVLVVSSEIASRGLPWADDLTTAGLFSDGAAAILVSAGDGESPMRLGPMLLETYPDGYDYCQLPAGGTRFDYNRDPDAFAKNRFFKMDGPALYKLCAQKAPAFIDKLLAARGWRHDDVDIILPHQASPHGLAHLARRCGFKPDRIVDKVSMLGNQIAASLPTIVSMARQEGRLISGMKAVLIGTSAGVSIGAMTLDV